MHMFACNEKVCYQYASAWHELVISTVRVRFSENVEGGGLLCRMVVSHLLAGCAAPLMGATCPFCIAATQLPEDLKVSTQHIS